jgi:hypothetical protein
MQEDSEAASEPPEGKASPSASRERAPLSICQSLLGIHLGSPTALPREIELLLWYHQLHKLGVLDSEEYSWKKRQLLATPSDLTAMPPSPNEPTPEAEGRLR